MSAMDKKYSYILIFSISIFIMLGLIRTLVVPLNFWVDEMFHVFAAQGILATGQPILPSGLPYDRSLITTLLVAGSFQIFGISEFAARLPFIFIGAAVIVASYLLAKEIFGQRVALITALLLAISPWQIYWSTNARMYILLQLIYVVFLYFTYRAWSEWSRNSTVNRARLCALTGASLVMIGLAFQVHQFGILFVAAGITFLASRLWGWILEKREYIKAFNTTILFIVFVTGVAILAYLVNPLGMFTTNSGPIGMRLGEWFYLLFFGRYFPILGLFAAVSVLSMLKQSMRKESLLLLGIFIPFLMLSLFLDQKNTRYIFFIFPLIIMIASHGICIAWDWYRENVASLRSGVVPICIGLLLLLTGTSLIGATTDPYQPLPYEDPHPHWKDAATYIQSHLKDEDVILSTMPICTLHYLGKTDYWMRQNEYYAYTDAQGVLRDRYTGAVILTDYEMVVTELAGKEGWLIADRKLDSYFSDPDVLACVKERMTLRAEGSDHTIRVYKFEKGFYGDF